jgi:hypothetical protein
VVNKYYAIVNIGRKLTIRHVLIGSHAIGFVNYFIISRKSPDNWPASDFQRSVVKSEPILHIMKNFSTFEEAIVKKLVGVRRVKSVELVGLG